ncbi:MAG: SGNH/GDSL hydrolase family protein [Lachnospiraceae bacterium]|nr:SGNH/GDSL hydrolase family protein [Lachnospiraceae bacterium]
MTRKQVCRIILFLAVFVVLLVPLTYMLRTNGGVKDRFNGFYAEKRNSLDAVIIGSSSVFPYYSAPQIFGETGIVCYPLSTNLQRPTAQLYLAKEALGRQKPQLMIFELRMYTGMEQDMINNMAYTRGVTDNLRYSVNRLDAIRALLNEDVREDAGDDDTVPYTYWFDIFKYHGNYRSLRLPSQWMSFLYARRDPLKGFEGTHEVGPMEPADRSGVTKVLPVEDVQEKALRDLIAYLQETGQQALFVVSPYVHDEEAAAKFNYMEEIIAEAGMEFLDLNDHYDALGLVPEDFSDYGNHVNVAGAQKVTHFFASWLSERYDLPDRRGDDDYDSWLDAYARWLMYLRQEKAAVEDNIAKENYAQR